LEEGGSSSLFIGGNKRINGKAVNIVFTVVTLLFILVMVIVNQFSVRSLLMFIAIVLMLTINLIAGNRGYCVKFDQDFIIFQWGLYYYKILNADLLEVEVRSSGVIKLHCKDKAYRLRIGAFDIYNMNYYLEKYCTILSKKFNSEFID